VFRFLPDHNLHDAISRELKRKKPELDGVLVRDLGLAEAGDADALRWAATEGRIVLTHDRQTMTRYADDHVHAGERMPGLFVIETPPTIGPVIEDLLTIVEATEPEEGEGKTEYLPYKE
jgi:hypothetical protein